MTGILRALGWVGGLAIMVVLGVTALTFMPVSMGLPPCMKDWTSPSSFRPRASPLVSQRFKIGFGDARLCYGAPSTRGRTVFGDLVPFGKVWRLGANEPTRLYATQAFSIAGVHLPAGRYSLYAVPHEDRWEIAVNTSTFRWGNDFSPGVLEKEVGRGTVPALPTAEFVETLSVVPEPARDTVLLVVTWERTRVEIPIVPR